MASLRYYDQAALDGAVRRAWNLPITTPSPPQGQPPGPDWGVRRWTDMDATEGWTKPGDVQLHAELSRWADLVVVVPCSADALAKIASGFSDSLAVSLLLLS